MWTFAEADPTHEPVAENLVERLEQRIVATEVDIRCLEIEDIPVEPFGDELPETGFPGTIQSSDDCGLDRFTYS